MTSNGHIPILLKEVTKMLVNDLNGTYVDCTVGLGGHSNSILNKLNKNGFLIGIELDPYALSIAKKKLSNSYKNYSLHNTSYKYFPEILNESGIKKVNGFLFDLGISSYQVDSKHRGFSYLQDESLDMRFNPDIGITAKEYINNISECELVNLFKYYSDIRSPKKIASSIIEHRKKKQMNTTFDLNLILIRYMSLSVLRNFESIPLFFEECFKQLILGIIQGITEFLPISSSSHLILISKYLLTLLL